jgi:hypothetical protein
MRSESERRSRFDYDYLRSLSLTQWLLPLMSSSFHALVVHCVRAGYLKSAPARVLQPRDHADIDRVALSNARQRFTGIYCAFRGAFLNFFGKAAFGYFGCPAIARPLQDSRRPTS